MRFKDGDITSGKLLLADVFKSWEFFSLSEWSGSSQIQKSNFFLTDDASFINLFKRM